MSQPDEWESHTASENAGRGYLQQTTKLELEIQPRGNPHKA